MSTEQHVASVLFDNTPSVDAPPQAQEGIASATDEKSAEEILFGKEPEPEALPVPANIAKLREGDSPLFDAREAYNGAIETEDLIDAEDAAPELKAAAVSEFKAMANDLGLAPAEVREVVSLAKTIRAEPPTPEAEQEWQQAACKHAVELAGGDLEAAAADLNLARALVARDPRLVQLLESTRLGNHPQVIELMIQKARSERMRGRL